MEDIPEAEPGTIRLDVYPSKGRIVVRVYTRVKEGEQPVILQRLLDAKNSGKYLTSVAEDFPQSMRMLQKLMTLVSESTGDGRAVGISMNKTRPEEYSIYFIVG